jgi:phage-related protein
MIRKITFYKEYFIDFYSKQDKQVQDKIEYVFILIKQVDRIPKKFFKHLTSTEGLYEIRVEYQSNIYRIFCFFDKGQLVVLLNGFQKKTQKTPTKEIKIAEKLKKEYFNNKTKKDGKL